MEHQVIFVLFSAYLCQSLLLFLPIFISQKNDFEMYAKYCQNSAKSEQLRMKIGERHPFFLDCQRKLGHLLPLSAYLLKPIQRITKYQLLLRVSLTHIYLVRVERERVKLYRIFSYHWKFFLSVISRQLYVLGNKKREHFSSSK